jgi:hypothetical protein
VAKSSSLAMKKGLFPSEFAKVGPDGDQTVNMNVGCLPKVNNPEPLGSYRLRRGCHLCGCQVSNAFFSLRDTALLFLEKASLDVVMAWKEAAVLTLRREECASSSEWKEDRRNELKVSSGVTVAQKVHSGSRREWGSANAG